MTGRGAGFVSFASNKRLAATSRPTTAWPAGLTEPWSSGLRNNPSNQGKCFHKRVIEWAWLAMGVTRRAKVLKLRSGISFGVLALEPVFQALGAPKDVAQVANLLCRGLTIRHR